MPDPTLPHILDAIFAGLFTVLWWLVRLRTHETNTKIAAIKEDSVKDLDELKAAFEKEIVVLFKKHDQDAENLRQLEILIASKHYERSDLDSKFDKMEETSRRGFESLGNKFDKFTETFNAYVTHGRINGGQ
jgi:hypothetical protein